MAEENDQFLLRGCARDRCEASFSEFLHPHVDLVHPTALRILRDPGIYQAECVAERGAAG